MGSGPFQPGGLPYISIRSNASSCFSAYSTVWKNLPITAVENPFCFSISGKVTVPGGRCWSISWPLDQTPVVSGRKPVRNEVRDGLQQMACT